MIHFAKHIVDSSLFRGTVIAAIVFAGVLSGVETNAAIVAQHRALLRTLDAVVLAIFVAEIALKLASHGRRPLDYFRDGWNVFDFSIVALCLLPVSGPFASVLRLVRALRLLRLVSALPKLQLLVGALLKSLSAMGYVSLLLGLVFYIYAVVGVHLFGTHDPKHFGALPVALLSLFQMITLDDWAKIYADAKGTQPFLATLYFVSFILLGTMIMLNLFIGVITNSMAEMHTEMAQAESADAPQVTLLQIAKIEEQLRQLRLSLTPPSHSRNLEPKEGFAGDPVAGAIAEGSPASKARRASHAD